MEQTILVSTDSFNWGKADNLPQALKNAKYKTTNKVNITLYSCSPDLVEIKDYGAVSYPVETKVFYLTDGFEKLK
jgi:hypothetical protein